MTTRPLVQIKNLKKYFSIGSQSLKAVDDITLNIHPGEILGLVGESGCGKTTVGRTILRLYEPTSGQVHFDGEPIFSLPRKKIKLLRRKMQIIFQDPYASLNPRMTIQDIIGEALDIHNLAKSNAKKTRIGELLELVGLEARHMSRFPHEFSGGQRQRIGIARALAVEPCFIVCDEPISALDMSIQAQIINLLKSLQEHMGLTYLFISHDLSMVEYISDRVAVMYLGKIAEIAPSEKLYASPLHPYTKALLSSVPKPSPRHKNDTRIILKGEIPNLMETSKGCLFCSRCPQVQEKCFHCPPSLQKFDSDHYVACHLCSTNSTNEN